MHRFQDDKLIVYIPRCRCGRQLVPYGKMGLGHIEGRTEAAIMSNVTCSPAVTWTGVSYHCRKHPTMGYNFPIEDIVQLNQYPDSRIMFKTEGS
jgi:hypothetical protein